VVDRSALSRDAIVQVAREVVVAEGLEALSLRRVAANLGVTAPALYAHVADKDDLVRAVAEREFERLTALLEEVLATETDPLLQIRAQGRAYVAHARANPALFRVMFVFRPSWSPQPLAEELPAATKAFAAAAGPVEAAVEQGLLRVADPLLASLVLFAAAHGVATLLLAGIDLGADYEACLADTAIDSVLRGLAR
jgi:AcrR family transcriptional regulator